MKVSSIFDPTQKQTTYQTTSSRSTTLVRRQELTASVYKKDTKQNTLQQVISPIIKDKKNLFLCATKVWRPKRSLLGTKTRETGVATQNKFLHRISRPEIFDWIFLVHTTKSRWLDHHEWFFWLSFSMVEVSRESVDNKGTITNHTAAVSFLAFFWRLMLLQYIISGPGYNEKQHKKAGEKAMHVWTALAAGKNPRLMRRDNHWPMVAINLVCFAFDHSHV